MKRLLTIAILLYAASAHATAYYVKPTAGGSNDGSSWTNAWTSIQSAFNAAAAGDVVYCQGTQSISARIDVNTNSGAYDTGHIKFVGVNAGTTNEPPQASDYGDYFIIDGGNNTIDGLYFNGPDYVWLENIKVTQCDGTGAINSAVSYADNCVFVNVWCHDNAAYGISAPYFRHGKFYRCLMTTNTSGGMYRPHATAIVIGCMFGNNTGRGLELVSGISIANSLFYGASQDYGLWAYGGTSTTLIRNCVFDGNATSGLVIPYASQVIIDGCRFTNHSGAGDHGIEITANWRISPTNCYFGNNTTHITASRYDDDGSNVIGGSETNHGYKTGEPAATGDYTLDPANASATRRIQVALPDGVNVVYVPAGLIPSDLRASELGLTAGILKLGEVVDDVTGTYGGGGGGTTSHAWVR